MKNTLIRASSLQEVYDSFKWEIPEYFNIGVDVCDKWANQRYRLALIYEDHEGKVSHYTFWDIKRLSNQLANAFSALGITKGDRVGIHLTQRPETPIAHVAAYKLGAVAVPLFTLFREDALEYRLGNSGAKAVITDRAGLPTILKIRDKLPELESILVTGGDKPGGVQDFWDILEKGSKEFTPVKTNSEDPALIVYTSGTTGPPKGALHAHRTLLGHMPGVEFPLNFLPEPDDLMWTPADWAWVGGLYDALFPAWRHGIPVLAHRAKKFDPEHAFHLIAKYGVRNSFMPPTALKLMRQVADPRSRWDYQMRSISCAGEAMGEELLHWGREVMGIDINEFYGQTEVNLVVANCADCMEIKPGSMGVAVPGHVVEIIDTQGNVLPPGQTGDIAVKAPDPVMMLEYWKNPKATKDKFIGPWSLTGDQGRKDEDGYFWFGGRSDDVITSSGYRIGPSEIEDTLLKHPAVTLAAAIGKPDPLRTEIVKAFIVPAPGITPTEELGEEIKQFVKTHLAAHEYPREVEFVGEMPLTATGKIIRRELRDREVEKQEKG